MQLPVREGTFSECEKWVRIVWYNEHWLEIPGSLELCRYDEAVHLLKTWFTMSCSPHKPTLPSSMNEQVIDPVRRKMLSVAVFASFELIPESQLASPGEGGVP